MSVCCRETAERRSAGIVYGSARLIAAFPRSHQVKHRDTSRQVIRQRRGSSGLRSSPRRKQRQARSAVIPCSFAPSLAFPCGPGVPVGALSAPLPVRSLPTAAPPIQPGTCTHLFGKSLQPLFNLLHPSFPTLQPQIHPLKRLLDPVPHVPHRPRILAVFRPQPARQVGAVLRQQRADLGRVMAREEDGLAQVARLLLEVPRFDAGKVAAVWRLWDFV